MEFWGVEVKSGQPLKICPADKLVHLSQACLGEVDNDKGKGPVCLYLKVDDQKLVLGTLCLEKFPQLSLDLVVQKDFELSHNWKSGSVYFAGYKVSKDEGKDTDNDTSDADEDENITLSVSDNGNHFAAKPAVQNANAKKPENSAAKQNVKDIKSNEKVDDSDSDDSDSETSSDDDEENSSDETPNQLIRENKDNGDDESDDDDDEESDESESDDEEEETPKKAEPSRKRPAESSKKASGPDKKAKFVTPEKSGGKKGIEHPPTPHPSKQAGKGPANNDQTKKQAQKSVGTFPCKSCTRSFTTEMGLQAHTKAKHSATA